MLDLGYILKVGALLDMPDTNNLPATDQSVVMDHYAIVRKLIGPIEPAGETHVDCARLKNLDAMIHLVDSLLSDIAVVAKGADSQMHSIRFAGKKAASFLESASQEMCS